MDNLDFLPRVTIWAALVTYAGAEVYRSGRVGNADDRRSRTFWTLGCFLYVTHVVAAFHYNYDWRHTIAAAETLRSVAIEVTLEATERLVGEKPSSENASAAVDNAIKAQG